MNDKVIREIDSNDLVLYNVHDIQRILQIGKTKAYQLLKADGFPSFSLNKKMYVSQDDFNNWIRKNRGKTFRY